MIFWRSSIITICYDIKDIKGDRAEGVKTIPSLYGIPFTVKILHALNIGFIVFFVVVGLLTSLEIAVIASVVFVYSVFYLHLISKGETSVKEVCEILSAGEYVVIGLTACFLTIISKNWIFPA